VARIVGWPSWSAARAGARHSTAPTEALPRSLVPGQRPEVEPEMSGPMSGLAEGARIANPAAVELIRRDPYGSLDSRISRMRERRKVGHAGPFVRHQERVLLPVWLRLVVTSRGEDWVSEVFLDIGVHAATKSRLRSRGLNWILEIATVQGAHITSARGHG